MKAVIVGASYGGLSALKTLLSLAKNSTLPCKITMINPKSGFINVMAIPRLIIDTKFAQKSYVPLQNFGIQWDIVDGVHVANDEATEFHIGMNQELIARSKNVQLEFVNGKAKNLNHSFVLDSHGHKHEFDYCILASGRARKWPYDPKASDYETFVGEMKTASSRILRGKSIGVVGGGALGIEVAGELKQSFPQKSVSLIHPHSSLPPEPTLSEKFKNQMSKKLEQVGVNLLLNTRVEPVAPNSGLDASEGISDGPVRDIKTGQVFNFDTVLWCNKHRNNIDYLDEFRDCLVGDELLVNDHAQLMDTTGQVAATNIFAVGDLGKYDVIKKAGVAFQTGGVAATNVYRLAEHKTDLAVIKRPPPDKMAITVGSQHNVQSLAGTITVDNPTIVRNYADYKNRKVAKKLGLQL